MNSLANNVQAADISTSTEVAGFASGALKSNNKHKGSKALTGIHLNGTTIAAKMSEVAPLRRSAKRRLTLLAKTGLTSWQA